MIFAKLSYILAPDAPVKITITCCAWRICIKASTYISLTSSSATSPNKNSSWFWDGVRFLLIFIQIIIQMCASLVPYFLERRIHLAWTEVKRSRQLFSRFIFFFGPVRSIRSAARQTWNLVAVLLSHHLNCFALATKQGDLFF